MLAFLMIYFFLFGYPIGSGQSLVDGSLRVRYCPANFSCKKPTWRLPHSGGVVALVYAASLHLLVAGSPGSGDTPSFRNSRDGKRMRIRLTKKTNVRKRFGDDLGEQPIPKRWRADVFRGMVFSGENVGVVHYGVGSSRLSEPLGIG